MSVRFASVWKTLVCFLLLGSWAIAQETATEPKANIAKQPDHLEQDDGAEKKAAAKAKAAKQKQDAKQRAESLRKLAARLEVGTGATIADIGAGKGRDSWVFADIVGSEGRVFSIEITEKSVVTLRQEAANRKLSHVHPVLGQSETPNLPDNAIDMAFMHYVYHHLAQPRKMLRNIWQSLKPGGYLVVVDRHQGTLVDWVPREQREQKHFWLAETTFIREAREEGFTFVDFGETEWFAKNDIFVMIMQRPTELKQSGRDPDPMPRIELATLEPLLIDSITPESRVAFVALGKARELIKPILQRSSGQAIDIVLEEWATQKDERPAQPDDFELASVLTEKGDPQLPSDPIDAVFFLDTYHLLFHADVLLPALHKRLTKDGRIYVLDRKSEQLLSHREASHRRMIAPETVKHEMKESGFELDASHATGSPTRFLHVYRKR